MDLYCLYCLGPARLNVLMAAPNAHRPGCMCTFCWLGPFSPPFPTMPPPHPRPPPLPTYPPTQAGDPARSRETLVDKVLYPFTKDAGTDESRAVAAAASYYDYVKEQDDKGG